MTFYLGIDPTADSLHIGHFFALTLFKWLQDFGHHGIILIGGATALIGDPTGKSDMRKMLTKEQVQHNKNEVKELLCSLSEQQRHIVSHKKQEENDALDAVETVFSEGKHHDVAQHS